MLALLALIGLVQEILVSQDLRGVNGYIDLAGSALSLISLLDVCLDTLLHLGRLSRDQSSGKRVKEEQEAEGNTGPA
jgi:hypothetical protein